LLALSDIATATEQVSACATATGPAMVAATMPTDLPSREPPTKRMTTAPLRMEKRNVFSSFVRAAEKKDCIDCILCNSYYFLRLFCYKKMKRAKKCF
jgi:hypothetical protein